MVLHQLEKRPCDQRMKQCQFEVNSQFRTRKESTHIFDSPSFTGILPPGVLRLAQVQTIVFPSSSSSTRSTVTVIPLTYFFSSGRGSAVVIGREKLRNARDPGLLGRVVDDSSEESESSLESFASSFVGGSITRVRHWKLRSVAPKGSLYSLRKQPNQGERVRVSPNETRHLRQEIEKLTFLPFFFPNIDQFLEIIDVLLLLFRMILSYSGPPFIVTPILTSFQPRNSFMPCDTFSIRFPYSLSLTSLSALHSL